MFFGDFLVISRFWARFMAIFAFFRKSDKIGKSVLKFAKIDPFPKIFLNSKIRIILALW